MFHPTVFENLKVAFENRIYDLDSLNGLIDILNRADKMDFAVMQRAFEIQIALLGQPDVTVELVLEATLQDLADEILEKDLTSPGCTLRLQFKKHVQDADKQCGAIDKALATIWEDDVEVVQTLSYEYGTKASGQMNTISVTFKPKLDEEHIPEIPDFLEHVLDSLAELNRI